MGPILCPSLSKNWSQYGPKCILNHSPCCPLLDFSSNFQVQGMDPISKYRNKPISIGCNLLLILPDLRSLILNVLPPKTSQSMILSYFIKNERERIEEYLWIVKETLATENRANWPKRSLFLTIADYLHMYLTCYEVNDRIQI